MHILKSYTANVSVFKCIRKGGIGLTNITVLNRVSSIISLEIALNKIFLLHAHPQVIFYNCWTFHQYQFSLQREIALTRKMYGQTNGRTGWFLYTKKNFIWEGYNNTKWKLERNFIINAMFQARSLIMIVLRLVFSISCFQRVYDKFHIYLVYTFNI